MPSPDDCCTRQRCSFCGQAGDSPSPWEDGRLLGKWLGARKVVNHALSLWRLMRAVDPVDFKQAVFRFKTDLGNLNLT